MKKILHSIKNEMRYLLKWAVLSLALVCNAAYAQTLAQKLGISTTRAVSQLTVDCAAPLVTRTEKGIAVTTSDGMVIEAEYDSLGRMARVKMAGEWVEQTYDEHGNRSAIRDSKGGIHTITKNVIAPERRLAVNQKLGALMRASCKKAHGSGASFSSVPGTGIRQGIHRPGSSQTGLMPAFVLQAYTELDPELFDQNYWEDTLRPPFDFLINDLLNAPQRPKTCAEAFDDCWNRCTDAAASEAAVCLIAAGAVATVGTVLSGGVVAAACIGAVSALDQMICKANCPRVPECRY